MRDVITRENLEADELLKLAASVEKVSAHVLGEALVRAATEAHLTLSPPSEVREDPGQGIDWVVNDRRIAVGRGVFLRRAGVPEAEVISASSLSGHGSGEAHVLSASTVISSA